MFKLKILSEVIPLIMEDSIKEYIMSENTNLLLIAKTVGYMAIGSMRKILPSFLFKE